MLDNSQHNVDYIELPCYNVYVTKIYKLHPAMPRRREQNEESLYQNYFGFDFNTHKLNWCDVLFKGAQELVFQNVR